MTERPTEQNETDDVALIRRYVEQGDRDALAEFFRRYSDFAYRMACRVLRNPSEAEDAVQAAFVLIMRNAGKYRGGSGWVAQIVVNVSREMIRKSVRRRGREEKYVAETPGDGSYEAIADSGDDQAQLVKNLLDQLPEKYRIPVWLRHYEGLDFHVVAKTLRLPEGTVRSQVSRGVDMLRQALGRSGLAVSSLALLDMLPNLLSECAPASLGQSLASLAEKGAGAAASGGAAPGMRKGPSGLWRTWPAGLKPVVAVGLAVGAVGLGGGLLYFAGQDKPEVAEPVRHPPRDSGSPSFANIEYRWDFDSDEWPPELKVFRGEYRHRPDGGVNNSGCLEIENGYFEMLLDVPIDNLPVLVSYRRAIALPVPESGHMTSVFWMGYGPVAMFNGIFDNPSTRLNAKGFGMWEESRSYISASHVDSWTDSSRHTVIVGERTGDARLRLSVRGRHRIDNLTIRPISNEELPDASLYIDALAKIPIERRTGEIPLPELKPGRHFKVVTVRFAGGAIMEPPR